MKRLIFKSAVIGGSLPLIWLVLLKLLGEETISTAMLSMPWLNALLILLWPSSLLLLGSPEKINTGLFVLSLVLNSGLYALLAALLLVGIQRSKSVLLFGIVVLVLGWYGLLRICFG
jgi:hypothetical protein